MTPVDLTQLQEVVGKYADQHQMLVAAGPVTAASVTRMFTSNKGINKLIYAGGTWFAIQELGGPALKLIQDQFGNLQQLVGMLR